VYNQLSTDAFNLTDGTGKVCSIGYCYECYGLIVNRTLLGRAGYATEDITDFQSLKAVADDIHARADRLGFDAFTSSGMDDSSSWRFTGHLANLPLYYESVAEGWTGAPAQLTGAYLDNFKAVWDLYLTDCPWDPSTLATGSYDAQDEFLKGQAVFYQNGSWEYAALSQVYEDEELDMIPIYCGVEGEENAGLCAGTENCWAVNADASPADIQATLDFMEWMVTSPEGTAAMAEQFGAIPYQKAAESGNIFLETAEEALAQGRYNVDWVFQYTPNVDTWRAGLASALNQYDAGGSWDTVRTAFVSGWASQYAAANS
ncbi:MAG: ABC transporter substrate-binding protein, partial [Oscillospiraceae bacterium]|nr:ABC transporter substrate-binding protein [Oscillospiraceae bacterium]